MKLKELKDEAFIPFREEFALHNYIIEACQTAVFNPHIAYESSQWDLISGMVGENLGITFFPPFHCRKSGSPAAQDHTDRQARDSVEAWNYHKKRALCFPRSAGIHPDG
ncbi:LysR substrate-binding domain-containing protein [Peribacillus sp. SCS-26]|uniref:LysR substrate-binding domain-containing protein n=1 Tax=Paraperibacillus marinus TaxID=3115295 RepID=UPI003906310E